MTSFHSLAIQQIRASDAIDPDSLTDADILMLVQRYYAEIAADHWESHWRKQLSTLAGDDPIVGALLVAEWLVKGPEAIRVLAGGSSEFIETEAAVISMFSPTTPTSAQAMASDVAARFRYWVAGGMLLTALRRATQHLVYEQTTPEGCEAAFTRMKRVSDDLIAMTHAGAPKEALMARLAKLAGTA